MELIPQAPTSLRSLAFAVIDLETNGGMATGGWDRQGRFRPAGKITEVGLVQLQGPVIQDRFQRLCAIEGALPPFIQRLTGLTPAMLALAPSWERVALELAGHLEGRVWVAHHAAFDGSFLRARLPEGLWHRHRLLCTRLLVRRLAPELKKRSLGDCCRHFNLVNQRPHRALPDAEATAELLQKLLEIAETQGMDGETFLEAGSVAWGKV